MQSFIGIFYIITVFGSLAISSVFYVVPQLWIFLIAAVLVGPVEIGRSLASSQVGRIGAVHLAVAAILHPALAIKSGLLMTVSDQFELFKMIASTRAEVSANDFGTMTLALSRSLQYETLFHLKAVDPLMYWFHPASMVLAAWGLAIIAFRKRIEQRF